jgi:4-aminobutyrate aminotransferase-like enzyme
MRRARAVRHPARVCRIIATMNALTPTAQALATRDLATLWHPCTQMKDHEREMPLIPIRRGQGVWLEDFDGRRYLDGISSW